MRGRSFSSIAGPGDDSEDDALGDINLQAHPSADEDEFGVEETCCDVLLRHMKVAFCGTNATMTVFLLFIASVLALVGLVLEVSFADQSDDSDSLTSLRLTIDGDKEAFLWSVLFAVAIALVLYPVARAINYATLGLLRWLLFSKLVSVVLYIDAFDNGPLSTILWAVGANEVAVRLSGLPSLGALSTRLLVFFIVIGLVTGLKNLMLAILQGRAILDQFTSTVRHAVQRLVVLQNLSAAAVTVAAKRARLLAKFKSARQQAKAAGTGNSGSHIVHMDSDAVAVTVTGLDESAPTLSQLAASGQGHSAPQLMQIAEQEERLSHVSMASTSPARGPVQSSPDVRPRRAASVASVNLDSTRPDAASTGDATGFAVHSVRTAESGRLSHASGTKAQSTADGSAAAMPGADLLTQHGVQLAVLRPDGLLSTVLQSEDGDDIYEADSTDQDAEVQSSVIHSPNVSAAAPSAVATSAGVRSSPEHRPASEHHPEMSATVRDNLDATMDTPRHDGNEVDAGDLRDFEDEEDSYYVLSSYIEQGEFSLFDGKGQIIAVRNAAHAKKIVHGLFSALDVQNKGRIDREQLTWSGNGWSSPLGPGWSDESVEGAFAEIGADNAVSFSRADLLQFTEAAVDGFRSLHLTLSSYTAVTRALNMVSNVLLSIIFVIFFVVLFNFDVQPILISLGTVFVSLGFAISGPASNLVESLVFLLVTRPFELGDRVRFDKGDAMYVRRMDLYTTTFERLDGTIVTYRNSLLASREVRNEKRSGFAVISPTIEVSMNITPAQVEALNAAVVAYVRDRPQSWRSGMIEFYIYSIQPERNSMTFSFWLKHRQPFQDCCAVFGDTGRFMLFLCGTLRELGLQYVLPNQPVQISQAMDIGAGLGQGPTDMGQSFHPSRSFPIPRVPTVLRSQEPVPTMDPPAPSGTTLDGHTQAAQEDVPSGLLDANLLDKVHAATSRWVDVKAGDIAQVWRPELQKFKTADLQEMQEEAPEGQLSLGLPALHGNAPALYPSMLPAPDMRQRSSGSMPAIVLPRTAVAGSGTYDEGAFGVAGGGGGSTGYHQEGRAQRSASAGPTAASRGFQAAIAPSALFGPRFNPAGMGHSSRDSFGESTSARGGEQPAATSTKGGKPIELSHSVPSFGGLTLKPLNQRQKHTRDKTLALQRQRELVAKERRAAGRGKQLAWGRDASSVGSGGAGSEATARGRPSAVAAAGGSDTDTVSSMPPASALRSRSWASLRRAQDGRGGGGAAPEAFTHARVSMDAAVSQTSSHAGVPDAVIGRTDSMNSAGAALAPGSAGSSIHISKSHDNLSSMRDP